MTSMRKTVIAATCLLALGGGLYATSDWLKGSTDEKVRTLAEIQPGLGTVMIEYGHRYTTVYYAAKGGNWGLAAYQLKEMREVQEVGETTRPARAQPLKAFEKGHLDPLDAAIKSKDWTKFEGAFRAGVEACNACHVSVGFPYIKYQLPRTFQSDLLLKP